MPLQQRSFCDYSVVDVDADVGVQASDDVLTAEFRHRIGILPVSA